MKWTLLLALTFALATACEKSNDKPNESTLTATTASDPTVKSDLVGKWRLIEYFQDYGDGTGKWINATDPDEITFTATGEVIISANSPFAGKGFSRYRIIDAHRVELSSAAGDNKEIFYFDRQSDTDLIFSPQCRETCSRRYKKVG